MGAICKDCEEPLSAEILEAKPHTQFCIKCQSKHEKHSVPKSRDKAEYLTRNKKLKAERTKRTKAEKKTNRINQSLTGGEFG